MPARTPEFPVDNPSALIRSRIRERRIFEARFLCRQLGTEIEAKEKHALDRELTDLLAQVNTLRQLARQHIAEGRNDLADKLYLDIEQIAIDVPGLAEEKKNLAGVATLFARTAGKGAEEQKAPTGAPVVPVAPITKTVQAAPLAAQKPSLANQLRQRLQQVPRQWLLAIGIVCLVALALLLLLRNSQNRQNPLPPAASLIAPPKQTISIRPLESSPALVPGQPDQKIDPDQPIAETAPSPAPALKLEALQIEKSARE
jgi:hypothetical protein